MEQLQAFDRGTCGTSDLTDVLGFPPVLDACCGPKMMWFDRQGARCLFADIRAETHITDKRPGRSPVEIAPDVISDFSDMGFPDESFWLVVFDPPHIIRNAPLGWITKKYGVLSGEWREMLRLGFSECFRVLKPNGTLIFKWSDSNVPVSEILKLTPEKPLFGHRSGKQSATHWIAFMKPNAEIRGD